MAANICSIFTKTRNGLLLCVDHIKHVCETLLLYDIVNIKLLNTVNIYDSTVKMCKNIYLAELWE